MNLKIWGHQKFLKEGGRRGVHQKENFPNLLTKVFKMQLNHKKIVQIGVKISQRGVGRREGGDLENQNFSKMLRSIRHYGAREGVAYCHTRLHLKILANASRWTILWYYFLWEFFLFALFPERTRLSLKICS